MAHSKSPYLGFLIFLLYTSVPAKAAILNLQNKLTNQSSTYDDTKGFPHTAYYAVDGDRNTITHTLCSGDQWWRVDLGDSYRVAKITIVNRPGRFDQRLSGAIVRAGMSPLHSDNTMIGNQVSYNQANSGADLDFISNPSIIARYVSVELTGTCLHVAEVMVDAEPAVSSGELVDFTCLNQRALLPSSESTFIGGYRGNSNLEGASVTYGRTYDTGTGSGSPVPCSCTDGPTDLTSSISRLTLNCPTGYCECSGARAANCVYRIGAFFCQIDTGTSVDKITTITLNADAVVFPERQTITVNQGEAVSLRVRTSITQPDLSWRLTTNGLNGWPSHFLPEYNIAQVSTDDAGVYECHIKKQRGLGIHAIMRLIVRACPKDRFDPSTNCVNTCPVCYNGGVCHDQTGQCICAPGFTGSQCHIAKGRNLYGRDGTLSCRGDDGRHGSSCMGFLFCLQDPFGCVCAAGFKGLGCDQECDEPNTFGPYCSQTCHCADGVTCLKDTGECNHPMCTDDYCDQFCAPGWKGKNCQVETPCATGFYGELCNKRCNCRDNLPCTEDTGECINGCADGYIGATCTENVTTTIVSLRQLNTPNAGQPVAVQCVVVGNPLPDANRLILLGSRSQQIPSQNSEVSPVQNSYRRSNQYVLTGDHSSEGTYFSCYILGYEQMYRSLYIDVYEPPFLVAVPTSSFASSSSIRVVWVPWTSTQGRGDGPVLRYEVHYRLKNDNDDAPYGSSWRTFSNTSTSLSITGLETDTEYDFVVVVVREGEGGTGRPSNKSTFRTLCDPPTEAPTITLTTASGTELSLTWQFPSQSTWQCSALQSVNVYVRMETDNSFPSFPSMTYDAGDSDSTVLLRSLSPCTRYAVYAKFSNRDGFDSPGSDTVMATTATTAPGSVTSLSVFELPGNPHDQLGVVWHAPMENKCPVESYIVSHTLTQLQACPTDSMTPVTVTTTVAKEITTVSLSNLKAYSAYTVSVVATNAMGNSSVTDLTRARPGAVSSFIPTVTALDSDVTPFSIRFTWNEPPCEELNERFSSYRTKLTNLATNDKSQVTVLAERKYIYDPTPCTSYSLQVAVVNYVGTGTYSNATIATTDAVVPNQVGGVYAEAVDGHPTILQVSWNPPSGYCPIEQYTISYVLSYKWQCEVVSSSGPRVVSGTTVGTRYNITGLLPYSTYYVYVRASTSAGNGSYSSAYWMRTFAGAPIEPPMSVISNLQKKRSIRFEWQAPSCEGSLGTITGYSYILTDLNRNADNITDDTQDREVEIGDLVPYTRYSFQVRAQTDGGSGPYSDAVVVQTQQAKPPQLTSVTTPSADATSITVQWHRPYPPNGIIVAYYVIFFVAEQGIESNQTQMVTEDLDREVMRLKLTDLVSNSNYSIQVRAETVRKGEWSDPVYRVTQEGIPGKPTSLAIISKTQSELSISWDVPEETNGRIVSYTIKYRMKHKPYDLDFQPPTQYVISPVPNPEVRTRDISGLVPGTQYEILVSASTRLGKGESAMIEGYTEPVSDIPSPDKPVVDPARSTGTSVVISLPSVDNPYVVSYFVIVKKLSSRKRRQPDIMVQGDTFGSYNESPDKYVAAELDKRDQTGNFAVGDNKTYNGYHNPPLQEGTMYEIRIGSASKTDDTFNVGWSEPLTFQAGNFKKDEATPTDDGGNGMAGTIIPVIIVILLAGFVAFGAVFVIRRKRVHGTGEPFNSVGMTKVDNSKFKEKPEPAPQLKHVASEDALTNLTNDAPAKNASPPGALTLPADIHRGATVKVKASVPSSGPVKVDLLDDFVAGKRAKRNEGFKQDYQNLPNDQSHSWDVARKEENKTRNRYANIIAYDHSRVVLEKLDGQPHSDYINASYIDGYNCPKRYIASQGPNISSTNDMWRMIWQERSAIIVMVTHLVEGGKKKCEQYWPSTSSMYGQIEVTMESESKVSNYNIRIFKVKKFDETRKVTQFHFTSWPDMGLPQFTSPLLNFVKVVKEGYADNPDMGPIVVHCSAGVGRTGTFITIDSMLEQAQAEGQVDVLQFVANMRDKRVRMVQTQDQYMFIYDALLEFFLVGDTSIKVENLRSTFDKMKTADPKGKTTLLEVEFSKLAKLQGVVKADRFRGATDSSNRNKNRFQENLPLDRGRPYLMTMGTEQSTNYINASFINGYWKRDQYIITQLPMPNTTTDFWSMMYDYNSFTIVMLNPLDSTDETIAQYWPEKTVSAYGPFTVQLASMDTYDDIVCRTFTIDNMNKPKNEAHTIRQFEFHGWPADSDLPSSTMDLLKLIRYLDRWLEEATEGPITIQCIDGVHCSGVFSAILTMLDRLKHEKVVDVFEAVRSVRNGRPSRITKLAQYNMCYEVALMHLESFDIYENFR